jgi:hypothetical protein
MRRHISSVHRDEMEKKPKKNAKRIKTDVPPAAEEDIIELGKATEQEEIIDEPNVIVQQWASTCWRIDRPIVMNYQGGRRCRDWLRYLSKV